jgi:hypothetical protein
MARSQSVGGRNSSETFEREEGWMEIEIGMKMAEEVGPPGYE